MNSINLDIKGWMSEEELLWLHERAKEMSSIVEIGSWMGRSTYALLTGCKGNVIAVDHFLGNKEEQFMLDLAKDDYVYKEFIKNVGMFDNLIVERNSSLETADKYKDKAFDMVFIDGSHLYRAVINDIRAWSPKTLKLICGHDYDFPDVKMAVGECMKIDGCIGSIWYKYLNV